MCPWQSNKLYDKQVTALPETIHSKTCTGKLQFKNNEFIYIMALKVVFLCVSEALMGVVWGAFSLKEFSCPNNFLENQKPNRTKETAIPNKEITKSLSTHIRICCRPLLRRSFSPTFYLISSSGEGSLPPCQPYWATNGSTILLSNQLASFRTRFSKFKLKSFWSFEIGQDAGFLFIFLF
jgi:hypothetical protein